MDYDQFIIGKARCGHQVVVNSRRTDGKSSVRRSRSATDNALICVADEVLVDLMKSGCGVDYTNAIQDAVYREVEGVRIPFASPKTLWRMKQTRREKDIPDRLFLRMLRIAGPHR